MKIRTDYVTNSSSVSFMLTVHPEVSGITLKVNGHPERHTALTQLLGFARDKVMKEGSPVEIGDETVYALPVEFASDGDGAELDSHGIVGDKYYTIPLPEDLSDDEMLALLYGLLIFREGANLLQSMYGFGATQIDTF